MKLLICIAIWIHAASAQPAAPLPAAGNVAIPIDEYNRLVDMAAKPAKKNEAPPVPFAIQRAALNFQVSGATASGTVLLEGEVYAPRPVKVPLTAGMTIFDARRQGSPLPLLLDGASHVSVLAGPTAFSIALDAGLPVAVEAGRASVTIPAPAAGVVRLTLAVPGDHTSIAINGGLITSRATAGGRTTIDATLSGGRPAMLWWATRETAVAAPKEARYLADVKSLVTVGDSDLALAALAEITVVQGEPAQFEAAVPAGWEVTGATGATLSSSDSQEGSLILRVNGAARSHSFLITLSRPATGPRSEFSALGFPSAQRETGEILIEGEGAMELTAREAGGVKRMDAKEAGAFLRSMAHQSVQAAFRYHRQPGQTPTLALEWTRFPNTGLLAAVAQSATVTTLVTSEGRSLTEVKLSVRNREQPFLKVALPAGAAIVSADVAGQAVKPVQGVDGSRVPLLRAGFRPNDAYNVTFVIMHSGAPFAKKGGGELVLPKVDLPIGLVEWEVFLPQTYRVKDFGGDAFAAPDLPPVYDRTIDLQPGMIGGYIVDSSGAAVSGAQVTVTHERTRLVTRATTDRTGRWIAVGVVPGSVRVEAEAPGFRKYVQSYDHYFGQSTPLNITLQVGSVSESVEVTASVPALRNDSRQQQIQASANVANLQRRVAGVLPIAIDVPKAGNSYRFIRPLVVDEETKLTFTYRSGR